MKKSTNTIFPGSRKMNNYFNAYIIQNYEIWLIFNVYFFTKTITNLLKQFCFFLQKLNKDSWKCVSKNHGVLSYINNSFKGKQFKYVYIFSIYI